jgi:hypothetical protein
MFLLGIKYDLYMYICDIVIVVSELVDKNPPETYKGWSIKKCQPYQSHWAPLLSLICMHLENH